MTEFVSTEKHTNRKGGSGSVKDNTRDMPKIGEHIKNGLAEALSRTVYLKDLTISDITPILPHWRSSHLASLRALKVEEFGPQKLEYAAEKLGVEAVIHFVPPAPKDGFDGQKAPLFAALRVAADACNTALPELSELTYSHPLAKVSAETARLSCLLSIEAIRRRPHFAHRECEDFTLQLVSAVNLLRRISTKSAAIRRSIEKLESAIQALDTFSETGASLKHKNSDGHQAASA